MTVGEFREMISKFRDGQEIRIFVQAKTKMGTQAQRELVPLDKEGSGKFHGDNGEYELRYVILP